VSDGLPHTSVGVRAAASATQRESSPRLSHLPRTGAAPLARRYSPHLPHLLPNRHSPPERGRAFREHPTHCCATLTSTVETLRRSVDALEKHLPTAAYVAIRRAAHASASEPQLPSLRPTGSPIAKVEECVRVVGQGCGAAAAAALPKKGVRIV